MRLTRIPAGVLPSPSRKDLPEPPPLRRMIGPSVILAGLSIGSGEFVLWPRITAEWGFALFWACWVGVTIQFFLNMEIERYTLATGESAVVGFLRLSRFLGFVFLVCAVVPWIWPGWATGAGTILAWELGGSGTLYAVLGLVLCGVVLSLGPVVYRTVETIQTVLVSVIFVALIALAVQVVTLEHVEQLFAGAVNIGHLPEGIQLPLLLGALAFAGAGGSMNLAQSNYIRDKGYGMGRWVGRITSPLTGREEAEGDVGCAFEDTPENRRRWRVWWRRSNVEHGLTFYLLCIVSISLLSLITFALLESGGETSAGLGFIQDQGSELERRLGPYAMHTFFGLGVAILFSTELALLDAVTRVASDLLHAMFLRGRTSWSLSRLYFAMLWMFIGFGVLVLSIGFRQPLFLLVLSASLNAVVMCLYSGLLLWLNVRSFRGPLRPSPLRIIALLVSFGFFGYFSALTIASKL